MKAIETRYIGPTNFRGSRIVASDRDHNRIILSWDDEVGSAENHAAAAAALCKKMGWPAAMIGGGFPDGMVWVFVVSPDRFGGDLT